MTKSRYTHKKKVTHNTLMVGAVYAILIECQLVGSSWQLLACPPSLNKVHWVCTIPSTWKLNWEVRNPVVFFLSVFHASAQVLPKKVSRFHNPRASYLMPDLVRVGKKYGQTFNAWRSRLCAESFSLYSSLHWTEVDLKKKKCKGTKNLYCVCPSKIRPNL